MIVFNEVPAEAATASTKNKARRKNSPDFVAFHRRIQALDPRA